MSLSLRHKTLMVKLARISVTIFIFIGSLIPIEQLGPEKLFLYDKVNHFVGYGLLSGLWCFDANPKWKKALACLGFGVLIECLQPLTGRYFELLDILANAIGCGLGMIIAQVLREG